MQISMLLKYCQKESKAKLQNTPQLICISLNKDDFYNLYILFCDSFLRDLECLLGDSGRMLRGIL